MAEYTRPLHLATRRQIFRALVEVQDGGLDVLPSRRLIATKFGVDENDVRDIEEEGLEKTWPPL